MRLSNDSKAELVLVISGLLSCVFISPSVAEPSFQGLGDLPGGNFYSVAVGVSADGSVVVGTSVSADGYEAFRWTSTGGIVGMGDLPGGIFHSMAKDVSGDGSVVVGESQSTYGGEAFRWNSTDGMVGMGDLTGGDFDSDASGISSDGSVIVGHGYSADGYEATRWTAASGMVGLGNLPGGGFISRAWDVSADGSVVVGYALSASGYVPFRWTTAIGMVDLGGSPGSGEAWGASADGSVIVGFILGFGAFRWTSAGGMVLLGPGGEFYSEAYSVSADGSVVVGAIESGTVCEAVIWEETNEIRHLKELLVNDYGLDLTGWTLLRAIAISADALTIVGSGINPSGQSEAWIAVLDESPVIPEPPTPIEEILLFVAMCVEDGTLVGDGPGRSAENRLNALINMLEEAQRLIDTEMFEETYGHLRSAYRHTDGQRRPPDFVAGPAAPLLAALILELMESL